MAYGQHPEYDAFGPWVYIVGRDYPLPPLFAPYAAQLSGAQMVLKIPRKIERRKANPFMHLYDTIVAVFETHLLVLRRDTDRVSQQQIEYQDVQAIKKTTCLLRGELLVYTAGQTVEVEYNTVSDKVITQAAALIRSFLPSRPVRLNITPLAYGFDVIDHLYVNLLNELKKTNKDMALAAYQPRMSLSGGNAFTRAMKRLWRKRTLQCTAFVVNARELIVIERSSSLKKSRTPDYAYSYVYLPLQNIRRTGISALPKSPNLSEISFSTANHHFATVFNDQNLGIIALRSALAERL